MEMKRKNTLIYVGAVLLTEAVGVVSGLLSRGGMQRFEAVMKPALTPPAVVFPIVWTILYALMGIGAARVYLSSESEGRSRGLWLFLLQLILNFFWSLFFFNLQAFGFSLGLLVILWILILLMTVSFRKSDRVAALLQIPYLIWVAFAGYLNWMIWRLSGK